MGIERFVRDQIAKREVRGRNPAFNTEMAREKAEFSSMLKDLGQNTLQAGITTILKTPTTLFLNSLKAVYSSKYNWSDYTKDAVKLLMQKEGILHSNFKVAANAIHLAGKGAKIGLRQLFKM